MSIHSKPVWFSSVGHKRRYSGKVYGQWFDFQSTKQIFVQCGFEPR